MNDSRHVAVVGASSQLVPGLLSRLEEKGFSVSLVGRKPTKVAGQVIHLFDEQQGVFIPPLESVDASFQWRLCR